MRHITSLLQRQWKLLAITGALGALVFLGGSLLFPLEYRADADVLILTRQQSGADPLSLSRAQERITETIAATIETDSFYEQVVSGDAGRFVREQFDIENDRQRRSAWEDAVEARAQYGTNVMTISAYATSREQAERLAAAVAETIAQNGSEYVGTVIISRVVNQPIASRFPVRPNLLVNAVLGFLIGVIVMGWVVVQRRRPRVL